MYKFLTIIVLLSALVGCGQTSQVKNTGENSSMTVKSESPSSSLVEPPSETELLSSTVSSLIEKVPKNTDEQSSAISSSLNSEIQKEGFDNEESSAISSSLNSEIQKNTVDSNDFETFNDILDFSQKKYDFTSYCAANMDEDVYGGFSHKDDGVILYYLNQDQVKTVAEDYKPGWDGLDFKYVDTPIQIEYQEAKYFITFLKQVKQEIYKEMQKQSIDDHPDAKLRILDNR